MSVAVNSPLCAADLERWRAYIDRSESRHQILDVESLRRYAVSVGASPEVERTMPPLAHWAFFVDTVDHSMLGTDGYPELVVQGPLIAAKLYAFSQCRSPSPLVGFSFRLLAPLFVNQPVRLRAQDTDGTVEAVRCDGVVAVSARAAV